MLRLILVALLLHLPSVASADTSELLSTCVTDNTSGKDRKDLARWILLAMSSHPEFRQYASSEAGRVTDSTNQSVAALFESLITESCAGEANAAFKEKGSAGIGSAFEALGALAMQELMSNEDVKAAMGAFEKYVDSGKVNAVLTGN